MQPHPGLSGRSRQPMLQPTSAYVSPGALLFFISAACCPDMHLEPEQYGGAWCRGCTRGTHLEQCCQRRRAA